MPGNGSMQPDSDFEILEDEWTLDSKQPREDTLHWAESHEGWKWGMHHQPKGRPIPWNTPDLEVITRRLTPLIKQYYPRTTPPPPGNIRIPRAVKQVWFSPGGIEAMRKLPEDVFMRGYNEWQLWQMPYRHTTYGSHLNAYWHWYTNIRPGCQLWGLDGLLLAYDMHKICKAIVNERKAIRLAGMKNK